MSSLSDRELRWAMKAGHLKIKPEPGIDQIQPASIDLHLGETVGQFPSSHLGIEVDLTQSGRSEDPNIIYNRDAPWLLHPNVFILAHTQEWVEIGPAYEGILTGKSSLARVGLQVESAGYADPKWRGRLTLEIKNLGPYILRIAPGMLICQLRLGHLTSTVSRGYGDPGLNSHYQGSDGLVPARFGPVPDPVEDPEGE